MLPDPARAGEPGAPGGPAARRPWARGDGAGPREWAFAPDEVRPGLAPPRDVHLRAVDEDLGRPGAAAVVRRHRAPVRAGGADNGSVARRRLGYPRALRVGVRVVGDVQRPPPGGRGPRR